MLSLLGLIGQTATSYSLGDVAKVTGYIICYIWVEQFQNFIIELYLNLLYRTFANKFISTSYISQIHLKQRTTPEMGMDKSFNFSEIIKRRLLKWRYSLGDVATGAPNELIVNTSQRLNTIHAIVATTTVTTQSEWSLVKFSWFHIDILSCSLGVIAKALPTNVCYTKRATITLWSTGSETRTLALKTYKDILWILQ